MMIGDDASIGFGYDTDDDDDYDLRHRSSLELNSGYIISIIVLVLE